MENFNRRTILKGLAAFAAGITGAVGRALPAKAGPPPKRYRQFTRSFVQQDFNCVIDMPYIPHAALMQSLNSVNLTQFGDYPPETLRVSGASANRFYRQDGSISSKLRISFSFNSEGWNHCFSPDGSWVGMTDASGEPPYPPEPFHALMPMGVDILKHIDKDSVSMFMGSQVFDVEIP